MYLSRTSIETPLVEETKYSLLQSVLEWLPQYGKLCLSCKKELDFDFKQPIIGKSLFVIIEDTTTTEIAMLDSTSEVTISVELPGTKENFRRAVLTPPKLVKEKV